MIAAPNYATALALDAADGVIDGRLAGAQIGIASGVVPSASYSLGTAIPASYSSSYIGSGVLTSALPLTTSLSAVPFGGYSTVSALPVAASLSSSLSYVSAAPVSFPTMAASYAAPAQCYQCIQAAPQVQCAAPVQYVQAAPQVQYVEVAGAAETIPNQENIRNARRVAELEEEIRTLRMRTQMKQEVHSTTRVEETYKVKTFEMAAKLSVMDGTDDGLYNGLPIEVEGMGLYRDLVARGHKPRQNVSLSGRPLSASGSVTRSETYKVATFELAEKLANMSGRHDGKYNGVPIEVAGEGLYTDLLRAGRRSRASPSLR